MYCQNCGKEIKKGSIVCKQCGTKVIEAVAVQGQRQLLPLTPNQKATLAAIRKYEEKNKLRLGAKGSFSKKYGKLLAKPEKAISEKERLNLKKKHVVESYKNIKIPMRIPLHLPPEIIKEIKEKKVTKLTLQRIEKGERVKLSYTTTDGKTKDIAATTAKFLTGRSAVTKYNTLPFVGLGVVKCDEGLKLDLLIPSTPTSFKSEMTKNQGDVLYLKSKADEGDHLKLETKAGSQENGLNNMLSDLITPGIVTNLLGLSRQRLDNVAWHDFSYHEYVLEPELYIPLGRLEITQSILDLINELDDPSLEITELIYLIDLVHQYYYTNGCSMVRDTIGLFGRYLGLLSDFYVAALIQSGSLSTICEIYFSLPVYQRSELFNFNSGGWKALRVAITWGPAFELDEYINLIPHWQAGDPVPISSIIWWQGEAERLQSAWGTLLTSVEAYEKLAEEITSVIGYPFTLFRPFSFNLGLRLIYRQEWRPLGLQRGETVKTIPLGPKQVEKISTKIIRRSKVSKTAESLKAIESTTESSETTKDSSEIVKETADTFGWKVEAEASCDFGFAGGSVSTGITSESEEKNKRASTHLSESMQKTANKLRKEDKVVISTESESSFEITTASEIQNPNDEIPITYIFSKLQRQYEILTRLAEVNSVIFVAEPVPLPYQVTKAWVKKHDWIIAKALLDDSFRDALTTISQDASLDDIPTNKIDMMMDNATSSLGTLADKGGNASLNNIDVIQEAQRAYRESYKENLEKKRNRELLNLKQQRLLEHIRENILHYCRAIWSQEDPEQRMLRYKKRDIRIPTIWGPVIDDTDIPISGWSVSGLPPGFKGHFVPIIENVDTVRPIIELINPAGPIGFAGNYAIYYLKSDAEIDLEQQDNLFDMLHLMKSSYMDLETGEFMDPAIRIMRDANSTSYIPIPDPIPIKQRKEMVDYVPVIRAEYEDLDESEKDAFLKDGLLPEERKEYEAIAAANDKKIFLKENSCFEESNLYYEYLFRKEYSRRLLLDSNNLLLDLEAGTGSALETFKKLHRYVDVLKAIEEKDKMNKENERRKKLMDAGQYGDPDIEKVTIVTGAKEAAGLIATSLATEAEGEAPDDES